MPPSLSLLARGKSLPAPLQGALLMTAAALMFAVMNATIKLAAEEGLHPFQIAFFRNAFALAFVLPWLLRMGWGLLHTERLKVHLWRAGIGLVAMLCWFTAVVNMPMAEAVALNFTIPLFATAGAALFLGEVVRARRWTATAVGFIGVLIILRPGFVEFTLVTSLPIISAGFMAVSVLIIKSLSRTEEPMTVVLYMNLLLTPLSLVPALFVWETPSLRALLLMALVGACAVVAHIAFTRAFVKAAAFDPAALVALASVLGIAIAVALVKLLPAGESHVTMLTYFCLASLAMTAGPALLYWQAPSAFQWLLLAAVGFLGVGSQAMIIRAYRSGEVSFVAPFDYLKLILAGLIGFLVFAEVPDLWTVAGALVIVGATFYIARREVAQQKAAARPPAAPLP